MYLWLQGGDNFRKTMYEDELQQRQLIENFACNQFKNI